MPCKTCGHTLQNLGLDNAVKRTFHCPRCGTLTAECDSPDSVHTFVGHTTPFLVDRVRVLLAELRLDEDAFPRLTAATLLAIANVREAVGEV